ncbi:hypothetical protein KKF32_01875 [Patescibacteria group bacterium]|nr:hypothetical protein [Patescibacteria group bacterium]
MFFPILVVVVGIIWLLKNLGVISTDAWLIIFPVAVILAGLTMFSKKSCPWCSYVTKQKEETQNQ